MVEINSTPSGAPSDGVPCLEGETLSIMEIINLARGVEPTTNFKTRDLPPPWQQRYVDLRNRVRRGEVLAEKIGQLPKHLRVSLRDLAPFADKLDHHWQWLRDFCQRWALARGEDLQEIEEPDDGMAENETVRSLISRHDWAQSYYPQNLRRLNDGKIQKMPSREEDLKAARKVLPNITLRDIAALRKKYLPKEITDGGRPKYK